ncbi:hypothetical protein, partial [Asanoa sp. NPDC050611]|uniref:hypothetical protein n=1 Tax=Asanoa sp. NPDC050611 TaxID=3157098 RepID=UPI0033D1F950
AAVGPSIDVALDLHGRASLPFSRRLLPLLEPLVDLGHLFTTRLSGRPGRHDRQPDPAATA